MGKVRLRVVLLALVFMVPATLLMPISNASSHTWTTYYYHKWLANSDPKYWFNDSLPDSADFRQRVRDASNSWNAQGGTGAPDFLSQTVTSLGRDCSVGRNMIEFANLAAGVAADTPSCWYTTGLANYYGFSIRFNSDMTWYTGTGTPPAGQIDLQSIATHEFGHATGFGSDYAPDHFPVSECPTSSTTLYTMCPSYPTATIRWRTLEVHDIHTLEGAY